MTMSVDGLVSGMDTTAIITQLLQAEANPQILLKQKLSAAQIEASAYRTVNTTFAAVRAAAESLTATSLSAARKVSSSAESVTASAASTAVAQTLAAMASALSPDGTGAEVRDVVPLPADDPRGAGLAALILPLVLGAILPAVALGSLHLRRRTLLTATAAYALVGGLTFAAVLHWVFGTLDGSYWTESGVLAAIVAASTLALVGLQWVAGRAGLVLGALLLALVGNPLSGATTAPEFLASPWREIGQAMPPGAGAQLVRSVAFFDGAGAAGSLWVLPGWLALGLLLVSLAALRDRRRPAPVEQRTAGPATVPA
jgi:hypothetical protein